MASNSPNRLGTLNILFYSVPKELKSLKIIGMSDYNWKIFINRLELVRNVRYLAKILFNSCFTAYQYLKICIFKICDLTCKKTGIDIFLVRNSIRQVTPNKMHSKLTFRHLLHNNTNTNSSDLRRFGLADVDGFKNIVKNLMSQKYISIMKSVMEGIYRRERFCIEATSESDYPEFYNAFMSLGCRNDIIELFLKYEICRDVILSTTTSHDAYKIRRQILEYMREINNILGIQTTLCMVDNILSIHLRTNYIPMKPIRHRQSTKPEKRKI